MPPEILYGVIGFLVSLLCGLLVYIWQKKDKLDDKQDSVVGEIFREIKGLRDFLHEKVEQIRNEHASFREQAQRDMASVREDLVRLETRLSAVCPKFGSKGKCE